MYVFGSRKYQKTESGSINELTILSQMIYDKEIRMSLNNVFILSRNLDHWLTQNMCKGIYVTFSIFENISSIWREFLRNGVALQLRSTSGHNSIYCSFSIFLFWN